MVEEEVQEAPLVLRGGTLTSLLQRVARNAEEERKELEWAAWKAHNGEAQSVR